jgi:hypothetical protein
MCAACNSLTFVASEKLGIVILLQIKGQLYKLNVNGKFSFGRRGSVLQESWNFQRIFCAVRRQALIQPQL